MSELNLSHQLIKDVQAVFEANDPDAADSVTFAQYLAAIMGYTVSDITAPEEKVRGLLEQLNDFSVHVFDEEMKKKQPASFTPPGQEAFGIWRPS